MVCWNGTLNSHSPVLHSVGIETERKMKWKIRFYCPCVFVLSWVGMMFFPLCSLFFKSFLKDCILNESHYIHTRASTLTLEEEKGASCSYIYFIEMPIFWLKNEKLILSHLFSLLRLGKSGLGVYITTYCKYCFVHKMKYVCQFYIFFDSFSVYIFLVKVNISTWHDDGRVFPADVSFHFCILTLTKFYFRW